MVIKINYTSSDIYVSTNVSPVYVVVNYSGTSTGGGVWGQITGTLSNQTDLQNALNAKFDDPTGTTLQYLRGDGTLATFPTIPSGTVTSVGLTMPSAFSVANSPVTSSGTLTVTGAGTASQYVRGDGQLANFPDNGGGGSSVNYYLNGSVNQGTFGGDTYYEMSKTPVLGAGTNFTRTNAQGNGYIASFITDAGDPALLNIPGGNWNLEFYFNSSASGGSPQFYGEVYKVSSANVFTLVASGSSNPEGITNGTTIDQYFTSIPVPQTSLLVTDRLAVRIYVIPAGRTITLHTENSNLCEVLTTFSTGLNALNGLTAQVQYFATGTSGTDFEISSATDTHTFNLPTASATNRGALSSADWTTFSGKVGGSGATGQVAYWNGTSSQTGSNNLFWDAANSRLGIGTNTPSRKLHVIGTSALFQNAGEFELDLLNTTSGNYLRLVAATADSYLGTIQNIPFSFIMNGSRVGQFTSTNGNLILQNGGTFTDGGERLQVNGTAKITGNTLISAGNLSIFTTNTPRRLNINQALGGNAALIGLYASGGSLMGAIGAQATTDNLQFAATAGILFYSGSTIGNVATEPTNERMRLTSAGRLLLGTTTESTFLLDVNGTARVSGLLTIAGGTSSSISSSDNRYLFGGSGSGTEAIKIGQLGNANGNYSIAMQNGATASGLRSIALGTYATATGSDCIALGGYSIASSNEFQAGGFYSINNVYFGSGSARGNQTNGVGVDYTINGSGALGTNFAGGNITIAGGKGTGSGTSGDVVISTATPTTSGTTLQSLTQRFKVFGNTGNVLIQNGGTFTDGGQRLQVQGTSYFSDTLSVTSNTSTSYAINIIGRTTAGNASTINFFNNAASTRYGFVYVDSSTFEIGSISGSNIPLIFSTNQSEKMRIAAGGNVGIGTTTPSAKLHVDDGAGAALYIGLGTYNYYRAFEHIWQSINGTFQRMSISSAGNLLVGTAVDTGERVQVSGSVLATSFVKSGGTSAQYLMADGSVTTGGGGSVDELQVSLICQVFG